MGKHKSALASAATGAPGAVALALACWAAPAAAQDMIVHRHDSLAITWEADGKTGTDKPVEHPNDPAKGGAANPDAGNSRHQHYNAEALTQGDISHEPFVVAGVWVNRTNYNFVPEVALPGGGVVKYATAKYPAVPHGFIDESKVDNIPRFRFVGANWDDGDPKTETTAEKALPQIVKAFETWSALDAKESPVSKLALITGLEFRRVAADAAAEIDVVWGGTTAKGAFERQINNDGVTTSAVLRFSDTEKFFFGKPEDTPANETFFYTVALHEVGHVVGLDHQGSVLAGLTSLMFTAQQSGPRGARDTIDDGSMQGAFALYSVPVPEPAAWALALAGLVFLVRRRPGAVRRFQFAAVRRALLAALALPALAAQAITINRIDAPPNLLRPIDDATYAFPVLLQATIDANEAINGAVLDIYYRDQIPFGIATDATIDGVRVRVPAGQFQAGAQLGAVLRFQVGCATIVVTGETFGPLTGGIGTTGNSVTLAEFVVPGAGPVVPPFGAVPLFFGNNRVECIQAGLQPSNGDRFEQMLPLNKPPSGSQIPSLPPPRETIDFSSVVPEPAAWWLACLGLAALAIETRRRAAR